MKRVVLSLILVTLIFGVYSRSPELQEEKSRITEVIERGYVIGMFKEMNLKLLEKFWHKDCDLVGFKENRLVKTNLRKRIELARKNSRLPKPVPDVNHQISVIDVTGNAAMVKVQIYFGKKHIYTDYFSLYKFKEGWMIVTKIWYRHK